MEPFNPIAGKPPRRVVIDRQRKLFASLDIEDLLCELVSNAQVSRVWISNGGLNIVFELKL